MHALARVVSIWRELQKSETGQHISQNFTHSSQAFECEFE